MENHEVCDKVRSVFDPMAARLKLKKAIVVKRGDNYSISYPGPKYGLEIQIDMMEFFIMPLVYVCSQKQTSALSTYREEFGGKRHKDYLELIAKRIGLNSGVGFETIKKMQGDHLKCEEISLALAPLIEAAWPSIVSRPFTEILPE